MTSTPRRDRSESDASIVFELTIEWVRDCEFKEYTGLFVAKDMAEAIADAVESYDKNSIRKIECRWVSPLNCIHTTKEDFAVALIRRAGQGQGGPNE